MGGVGGDIESVVEEASAWMDLDGVEFVGQGEYQGADCIVVGVSRPVEEMRAKLPRTVRGYAVIVEFSGGVQAE